MQRLHERELLPYFFDHTSADIHCGEYMLTVLYTVAYGMLPSHKTVLKCFVAPFDFLYEIFAFSANSWGLGCALCDRQELFNCVLA